MEVLNNYFQRYTQKENVITDNTMRLFKLLQTNNINRYYELLQQIGMVSEDTTLSPTIMLQPSNKNASSIPDAQIVQKGYNFIIETKRDSRDFDFKQLKEHTKYLDNIENNVLLTISKQGMEEGLKNKINDFLQGMKIKHFDLTFDSLIDIIRKSLPEEDEFHDILNDYEEFCLSEQILREFNNSLYAFAASNTLEDDLKYNVYWFPKKKYYHIDYIGLYQNKEIIYIGKTEKPRINVYIDEHGTITNEIIEGEKLEIIKKIIDKYNYKSTKITFYFVKEFVKTSYKKVSPYGILFCKAFDLDQVLDMDVSSCDAHEIAEKLKNYTWK